MLLVIAVALSVGMLVATNRAVWRQAGPNKRALLYCFLWSGAPICCVFYLLPLLAQGALLAVTLPLASVPIYGIKVYRVTSVLVAVAVWVIALVNGVRMEQQFREWERQTPAESLTDRVPIPSGGRNDTDDPMWKEVDNGLARHSYTYPSRSWSLEAVHDQRVFLFHQAAGFGMARMLPLHPQPEHFAPDLTPPVAQPERYEPNAVSLGDEVVAKPSNPFGRLHVASLLDFVNPDGFGYVKSRSEVAGFRPHRFSKVPDPVERWEVRRVELVGLLLHPTPAVYVSEHLPRMDELKGAVTREPDAFEAEGLKAIRTGDDLYSRGDEKDVRMIGAIRSVSQCVQCHGGKGGELLGAFSYRLRREGK